MIVGAAGDDSQRPVYLKDLGLEVKRDYQDPRQLICRYVDPYASRPAVMIALSMKSGANIIDICSAARDRIRELQEVE